MNDPRVWDIFLLVVLSIVLVALIPRAWSVIRIYAGIRSRRLEDATSFAPPMPLAVAALAARLGALGFMRIGERSTVLPGRERLFEWDLVDRMATTYVAMVDAPHQPGGALMVGYSAFGDGAFVSTSFPTGATVQRPDLSTAPVPTSPEDAAVAHQHRLALFAAVHGSPLLNRSMADLLQRDSTYRSRHGGATLRTRVYRFTALTGLVAVAAAVVLVRLVALD